MSEVADIGELDRERIRELFDLRASYNALFGGGYQDDPYPAWHRLREQAAVHPGIVHELTGFDGPAFFHGVPEEGRPHFSAFSYAACDSAYRNEAVFASSPDAVDLDDGELSVTHSMLSMNGPQHRRYRGLVQPSFVPARAEWWIRSWIDKTVTTLVDRMVADGRAELNVDFCAAIPVLTITGSFGVPVHQALDIRAAVSNPTAVVEVIKPIVAARRENPQDDLISVLVQAEMTDEDGVPQRLSDAEIYSFTLLLLAAGSGTTWKQMGITLTALLQRPEVLAAVRDNRQLLKPAIEESLRWSPTDPMFSRWVTDDTDFYGLHMPKGSVLHLCLGAASRDPARWDRPDDYDIHRPLKPSLAFGGGPHVCLGMHVARAEMMVGIGALLDRLPNLRLDADAEAPQIIGMYERGIHGNPCRVGRLMAEYQSPDLTLLGPEHIRRYQETGGEVGYLWNGAPTLLLTAIGRTSGEPRTSALIFARDGDDYLVVASMGGAPTHPQWYRNLSAHPEADIQVKADHVRVAARTAAPQEKPRLWQIVTGVWPNYDAYQSRTDRVIPVVVLTPV